MKHKTLMNSNKTCFFCDNPTELLISVDSRFGELFVCKNCCQNLYKKIGSKLVPQSPTNLFQNINNKERK